jgi:diguanylate cyclase (GGDEF)-like protein
MVVAFNDHRATSVDNFTHPFTICPVDVLNKNVGFIALDRPDTTTQDLYVLESLIRIYQNFVSVLIDNQRDTLTGLLNRKIFDDSILKLIELRKYDKCDEVQVENERRSIKSSDRFWLGIFDIDDFKRINDTFGHVYGDEILILIGRLMQDVFRATDLKFRFGGEEFIAVVRAEQPEKAYAIFERFRKSVENYRFPQTGTVTVSIGIVEITGEETTSVFVGSADKALYHAKSNGKNMTCLYSDLVEKGLVEPEKIQKGDVLIFDE